MLVVGGREIEPFIRDAELLEGGEIFLRVCKCLSTLARLPSSKPRVGAMPRRTRFVMLVRMLGSKLRDAQAHDELVKHAAVVGFRFSAPLRGTSAIEEILLLGESTAFMLDRISKKQPAPGLIRVPWAESLALDRARLRGRSDDAMQWISTHLTPIDWEKLRARARVELLRIEADRRHPTGSFTKAVEQHLHRVLIYDDGGKLKRSASEILRAMLELHAQGAQAPFNLNTVAARSGWSIQLVKQLSPALQSLGLVTKVGRAVDISDKGRAEALAASKG